MKFLRKIKSLFRKEKLDADMTEELQLHLEQRTREHIAAGMSPADARHAALRKFGGVEQVKEIAREQRTSVWLEQSLQDVRYGLRSLWKSPGFAGVAILTLALGIGANTAMFTVANALLLRALPVKEPAQLFQVQWAAGYAQFSYPTFVRLREAATLAGFAAAQSGVDKRALIMTTDGAAETASVRTQAVSGEYFSVLGVSAALGRTLMPDDDRPAAPGNAVVLSYLCWQRRFGGDPAVIGRAVQIDAVPYTIVGVMPAGFAGFEFGAETEMWWPMHLFPQMETRSQMANRFTTETWGWTLLIARVRSGVSLQQAGIEIQMLFHRGLVDQAARDNEMNESQRREFLSHQIRLLPAGNGYTRLRAQLERPLAILAVMVATVLLIACANIAGLLLARGMARQRELAVRAALGAGRSRIVRQLLTESVVLALLGGAVGILLAGWGTDLLASYLPATNTTLDLKPDVRVLGFALGASVVTGLFFGAAPALWLSRGELMTAAKAAPRARSWLNQSLVVAQIALSVTLLAGAGLFIRSLQNLRASDFGFQPMNRVGFALEFGRGYDMPRRAQVHRRVLEGVSALPGVKSATVSGAGVFSGDGFGVRINVEGYVPRVDDDMEAAVVVAGPRFFETLGIPMRAGRDFTAADETAFGKPMRGQPRVAVVGESFARHFFGEANPVGRTLTLWPGAGHPPLVIIGVAKDIKYHQVRERPSMAVYVPYFGGVLHVPMTVRLATHGNRGGLERSIRAVIRQIDPGVAMTGVRALDEVVEHTLMQERVIAHLSGFFGVFALGLASLGLFGLLSYGVTQRTREIGVRMALGASPRAVVGLIVGQGAKLAVGGAVLGIGLALVAARLVSAMLYGVTPGDPATFAGVALLLLIVVTIAAWLPARRATKVDPMTALRCE